MFSAELSYRGRLLVVNTLCAPMLWNLARALHPPKLFIDNSQKQFVDFFWQGRHWIHKSVPAKPNNLGGQGLIHIVSRLECLRIEFVKKKYVYGGAHPWFRMTDFFLSEVV